MKHYATLCKPFFRVGLHLLQCLLMHISHILVIIMENDTRLLFKNIKLYLA